MADVDKAIEQIQTAYSAWSGVSFRLYIDWLPPLCLSSVEWFAAMVERWSREFFASQQANGLVTLEGSATGRPREFTPDRSICQHLRTVYQASQFVDWRPGDGWLLNRCERLADATIRYMNVDSGYCLYVRAADGFPESDTVNVGFLGAVTAGLARIGLATGRSDFVAKAYETARAVSNHAVNWHRGLIGEQVRLGGTLPGDYSSDAVYWLRHLDEARLLTGDGRYRSLILRHGPIYYEKGWAPSYRHYSTHINSSLVGIIGPSGILRGDTKTNCLHLLMLLYRLTGQSQYVDRFDACWTKLCEQSVDGWIASELKHGQRIGETAEQDQTQFLGNLLDAYETTGREQYLAAARAWCNRLWDAPQHWRTDNIGRFTLRLLELDP